MTGGQVSPTCLINQITSTTILGKRQHKYGSPLLIEKVLSGFDIAFLARGSLADKDRINQSKDFIRDALIKYLNNDGFCMIELLSPCPTNLHMSINDANNRIIKEVEKIYKIGQYK